MKKAVIMLVSVLFISLAGFSSNLHSETAPQEKVQKKVKKLKKGIKKDVKKVEKTVKKEGKKVKKEVKKIGKEIKGKTKKGKSDK